MSSEAMETLLNGEHWYMGVFHPDGNEQHYALHLSPSIQAPGGGEYRILQVVENYPSEDPANRSWHYFKIDDLSVLEAALDTEDFLASISILEKQ